MRFILSGIAIISLFITSGCMNKKSTITGVQNGPSKSTYNPLDAMSYRGEECPNGLTINIIAPQGTLSTNTDLSFSASVTGCKYGYDAIPELGSLTQLSPISPVTDPVARMAIPHTAQFNRNFSTSGSKTVTVYVYTKNSLNTYTGFFVKYITVNVVDQPVTPSFSCSVSPSNFPVRADTTSSGQLFVVSSTADASKNPRVTEIAGSDASYVIQKPTTPISVPTTNGLNVSVAGRSGTVNFTVQADGGLSATCSATGYLRAVGEVSGNFIGRAASETVKDRFYLAGIFNNQQLVKVDYARPNGFFLNKILDYRFALNEAPEYLVAGDLDNDGKEDVIFFRAGQAYWMKAVGVDESTYNFNAPLMIPGTAWPTNAVNTQILSSLTFELGTGGQNRLKGRADGKSYFATISTSGISLPQLAPSIVDLEVTNVSTTDIELATIAAGYVILAGGRSIPITNQQNRASPSYPGGGWSAIAVRAAGAGYELLWQNLNGTFALWVLDSSGAATSASRMISVAEATAWGPNSADVLLSWSGENVSNCKLMKCSVPSGQTTCSPNIIHTDLGGASAQGSSIRVTGLTASSAFQVACDSNNQSSIEVATISLSNLCPISNLVLSRGLQSAPPGRNQLDLPSLYFPSDMRNLDLRVNQVVVDDYNPELLVRGVSAKYWPFTSHGVFNLPASNDQIASSFQPGLNTMACKLDNWRPSSGAANPISCSFTMNGSYRTEGACLSDLTRAPLVGKIEKIHNKHLYGWACQLGSPQSIDVHLYVGGAAGSGGTFVQAKTANETSGDGVKNYCQSTGTQHRFKIDLRPFIAQHKGKSIYVHGICPPGAPAGCANDFISKSGNFTIPQK